MPKWRWNCTYEKGGGPWSDPDYEKCGARSRATFKSEKGAKAAAWQHEHRTGHRCSVFQITKRKKARRKKR